MCIFTLDKCGVNVIENKAAGIIVPVGFFGEQIIRAFVLGVIAFLICSAVG